MVPENNDGNRDQLPKITGLVLTGLSGPDVPEDWYLTYDGPAPVVEDVYDENYVVDRGKGLYPLISTSRSGEFQRVWKNRP